MGLSFNNTPLVVELARWCGEKLGDGKPRYDLAEEALDIFNAHDDRNRHLDGSLQCNRHDS